MARIAKKDAFDKEYFRQFYDAKFFDTLAEELKISDLKIKSELEDSVLSAAVYYELSKEAVEKSEPPYIEKQAIIAFGEALKKTRKTFKDLQKTGACTFKFLYGLVDAVKEKPYDIRAVNMLECFVGVGRISPSVLETFFELLHDSTQIAAGKEIRTIRNRSDALNDWVANIDYFWITYCNDVAPFTAGRYSVSDSQQRSKAVEILTRIINVIDTSVTMAQMVEAVKKRVPIAKKYCKTIS